MIAVSSGFVPEKEKKVDADLIPDKRSYRMISKIRHVGLRVVDPKKSVDFYKGLGFKLLFCTVEKWGEKIISVVKMLSPCGVILELIEGNDWPRNHFAVEVDHINDEAVQKENEAFRVGYITDPDGHYIELVEVKREKCI